MLRESLFVLAQFQSSQLPYNETYLRLILIGTRNWEGRTPLHVTGFDNRLEAAELLIKHSSNLNVTIYCRSAIRSRGVER